MATKSVIEIDVLDDKFKAFADAFAKYQEALKKSPADWQKVNKYIINSEKAQKDFNKSLKDGNQYLKEAARTTGQIASNLASAAISVTKWLALGAIGGGFGLGSLAASASDVRRRAQGIGVSTGALRSANVYLSPYINAEQTLSNIAELKTTPQGQATLSRLGGQVGQDPAQMLPELIRRSAQLYQQFKGNPQMMENLGISKIIPDQEALRRISNLEGAEREKAIDDFVKGIKKFEISDADSRAWQKFWVQLQESGNLIEKSLIKNLVNLSEPLEKLSRAVAKVIDDFLSSEKVKQGLENFATYLASPEFKTDVRDFMENLKLLGDGLVTILGKLGLIKVDESKENAKAKAFQKRLAIEQYDAMSPEQKRWFKDPRATSDTDQQVSGKIQTISEKLHNPGNLRKWGNAPIVNGFAQFGSDEEGLRAMASQLKIYQTRDKLNTLEAIISKYAPASENDTATYIQNAVQKTGYGAGEQLDLNDVNTLSKVMSAMTKQENFRSSYSPEYISKIIINNNTGNNATVTTQAVAPTPAGR